MSMAVEHGEGKTRQTLAAEFYWSTSAWSTSAAIIDDEALN